MSETNICSIPQGKVKELRQKFAQQMAQTPMMVERQNITPPPKKLDINLYINKNSSNPGTPIAGSPSGITLKAANDKYFENLNHKEERSTLNARTMSQDAEEMHVQGTNKRVKSDIQKQVEEDKRQHEVHEQLKKDVEMKRIIEDEKLRIEENHKNLTLDVTNTEVNSVEMSTLTPLSLYSTDERNDLLATPVKEKQTSILPSIKKVDSLIEDSILQSVRPSLEQRIREAKGVLKLNSQQVQLKHRSPTRSNSKSRTPKTPRTELFNQETHETLFGTGWHTNELIHEMNDHILSVEELSAKYPRSNINAANPEQSRGLTVVQAADLLTTQGPNAWIPPKIPFLARLCCIRVREPVTDLPVSCIVIREGEMQQVATRDVVVGDIIIMRSGQRVPADARIIQAVDFHVEVNEEEIKLVAEPFMDGGWLESNNICLGSALVTKGHAVAVVIRTGQDMFIFSKLR